MKFVPCPVGHPLRISLEHGIAETYARIYGAEIDAFPNLLVALVNGNTPICAAGIRSEPEYIFSQHYIDQPICDILKVPAPRVIEICHFAAFRRGFGPALLPHIVRFGVSLGADWAVFTATSELRCLLRRAHLPLVQLTAARRERVPRPESWGTYYDHDPWVCAIGADTTRINAHRSSPNGSPYSPERCHG